LVVHIAAGDDLTLFEMDDAATQISDSWGADIEMAYGATTGYSENGQFRLGVLVSQC